VVAGAVGDLAVEPAVVEPVDVLEGGELHVGQSLPGPTGVDQLPLVESVDALHQGVAKSGCKPSAKCEMRCPIMRPLPGSW
jgi:hypothetical protein